MTHTRESRQFFLKLNLCPVCGKNRIFADERSCPECKADSACQMADYRKKNREEYNSYHREYSKNRNAELVAKGICTRCGKREAQYGLKTCAICRNNDLEKRRIREYWKRQTKEEQAERYKIGLCYWCNKPVEYGYKVCEYHRRFNIEKANSSNAAKTRKNLIETGTLW